jgi:hypothetical protein
VIGELEGGIIVAHQMALSARMTMAAMVMKLSDHQMNRPSLVWRVLVIRSSMKIMP